MSLIDREVGWHPDPRGRAAERWWDGEYWTSSVRGGEPPEIAAAVDAPARPDERASREHGLDDASDEVPLPRVDRSPASARRCAGVGLGTALVATAVAVFAVAPTAALLAAGASAIIAAVGLVGGSRRSLAALAVALDASAAWVALAGG